MTTMRLKIFCALFLVLLLCVSARGQAISISLVNNLQFGTCYAGIPKVITQHTAGAAAEFHVSGTAGDEVLITFLTLPRYINQGGNNMNVVIGQTDCAMDSSATPNQSTPGYDNLNPWQPITYRLGANGLTIWLGATLVPNIGQKSGSYSGLIQVRAEYTGN